MSLRPVYLVRPGVRGAGPSLTSPNPLNLLYSSSFTARDSYTPAYLLEGTAVYQSTYTEGTAIHQPTYTEGTTIHQPTYTEGTTIH